MRWSVFVVMVALIVGAGGWVVFSHQNRVMVLKEPPASLAAWYKPQNKRQVWLHTMFKLRREMLAVEIYAKDQDSASLQNWAAKLIKDYLKIAEMVPEWANRVDLSRWRRCKPASMKITLTTWRTMWPSCAKTVSPAIQISGR